MITLDIEDDTSGGTNKVETTGLPGKHGLPE